MSAQKGHGDSAQVTVDSAILALIVSLDGDGSTTYLICTAALLPLSGVSG